jgi:4-amino-4-deoxy-L-arabinose transferase-like glycosyltransferase
VTVAGIAMLAISYLLGSPRLSGTDETYYAVVARNLVENGSLNTTIYLPDEIINTGFPGRDTHMAGYMMFLALPVALFGPTDAAFLLLSQLGYVVCGLLTFWAARRLLSHNGAFLSVAAFYVYPLFFFYANTALTEITLQVVALCFLCIWLASLQSPRLAHTLLLSLLLTVGTAIRPTFLLFLPTAGYALWRWPVQSRRRAVVWLGVSLLVLMMTIVYPLSLERAEGSYAFYDIADGSNSAAMVAKFLDNFLLQASRYASLPTEFPDDHIRLLQVAIFGAGIVALVRTSGQQRETAAYFVYTAAAMWLFLAVFYTPSGSRGLRNLVVVLPPGLMALMGLLMSIRWKKLRHIVVGGTLGLFLFLAVIGMRGPVQERREFHADQSHKAEVFARVLGPYRPRVVLAHKPDLYAVRSFPVNIIRRFPRSLEMMRQLQEKVTIDAIVVDDPKERDRFLQASQVGLISGDYRPVLDAPVDGYYFLARGAILTPTRRVEN